MTHEQEVAKQIKLDLDRAIICSGGDIVAIHIKIAYEPQLDDCDFECLFKCASELGYSLNYSNKTPYYLHYKKDNNQTIIAYYK